MTSPGLYRHYKGGLYRVLFVAQDSTNDSDGESTQEPVVVYISLTGPKAGTICVRTEDQFSESVLVGKKIQRRFVQTIAGAVLK